MSKIAETVAVVYIYIYIVSFNLRNRLYEHKAIIPYVFFVKEKYKCGDSLFCVAYFLIYLNMFICFQK